MRDETKNVHEVATSTTTTKKEQTFFRLLVCSFGFLARAMPQLSQ